MRCAQYKVHIHDRYRIQADKLGSNPVPRILTKVSDLLVAAFRLVVAQCQSSCDITRGFAIDVL
jgi:hypothetical protein